VELAPKIDQWTFFALVPPLGPDYTINFTAAIAIVVSCDQQMKRKP
jgi:hypothetical protein